MLILDQTVVEPACQRNNYSHWIRKGAKQVGVKTKQKQWILVFRTQRKCSINSSKSLNATESVVLSNTRKTHQQYLWKPFSDQTPLPPIFWSRRSFRFLARHVEVATVGLYWENSVSISWATTLAMGMALSQGRQGQEFPSIVDVKWREESRKISRQCQQI